jgi:hypothetical protein
LNKFHAVGTDVSGPHFNDDFILLLAEIADATSGFFMYGPQNLAVVTEHLLMKDGNDALVCNWKPDIHLCTEVIRPVICMYEMIQSVPV